MQNPAGLLFGNGVDAAALRLGQLMQGAHGHADVQRQRHPRRQQTVATEQRHEPRRTGRHEGRAIFGVVVDQRRAQVALAAAQDLRQRGMLGLQLARAVSRHASNLCAGPLDCWCSPLRNRVFTF